MKKLLEISIFTVIVLIFTSCGSPPPAAKSSSMTGKEQKKLKASLAKLDTVLKNKAPFIHGKLSAPAGKKDLKKLLKGLGEAKVQVLELWFLWHNGCKDHLTDILPLGRMLSIDESLQDRKMIQKIPFVNAKRKNAIKILSDAAGDGFFLDISSSKPRVFYDMLEDPGGTDYGTLNDFITFITQIHSAGIAKKGKSGTVAFDLKKYNQLDAQYLKNIGNK